MNDDPEDAPARSRPIPSRGFSTAGNHSRAVLYLRVSTKDQAKKGGEEEGFSIPAQREAGQRRAASLNAVIVEEFVDAGESAKSARRPELQRLLRFIGDHPVDFVIVHKVDRLARSRADDIEITLAIQSTGAKLISCTENIDETPSGLLLHGIMSSIAEFYSRNLANEVAKGLVQKAKAGGTPGKAPIGYRNVRHFDNGREVRTVELDEERAPLVRFAFDAYASGGWRLQALCDELNNRGLTVPATRSKPLTPLHVSRLHALLKNPYYKGIVAYCGVEYEGTHTPLVSPELWQRVQEVMAQHNHRGEKQRRHNHYLKSTLYCGRCGSRMIVTHSRSHTGRVYDYFTCVGKHQKRTSCTLRAVRIRAMEELVESHYADVELPSQIHEVLEPRLRADLIDYYADGRAQARQLTRKKNRLLDERSKLLQAHYAGAIPLELLKSEQSRISQELTSLESKLERTADHQALVEANLRRALTLARDCQAAYQAAPAAIRRQFNQFFFERITWDGSGLASTPSSAFKALLAACEDVAATNGQRLEWSASANSHNGSDPDKAGVASVKDTKLVAGAGFEPATSGL
jgi:site-specific DNA recombinase